MAEPADEESAALYPPDVVKAAQEQGHPYLMRKLNEMSREAREDAELEDE